MNRNEKGQFVKGMISWNKGQSSLPFCLDCNIRLKDHRSKRCRSCAQKLALIGRFSGRKGKKYPGSNPIQSLRNKVRIGDKALHWKGGIWRFYCIDCNKKVSFNAKRCKNCYKIYFKTIVIKDKKFLRKVLRRKTPSGLESKVIDIIKKYNLPYKFVGDGKFFIEKKNPDFININGEKKAIEVYSRFHKNLFKSGVKGWKKERQNIFSKYGWEIIFIEDWQTNQEKTIINLLKGGQ